MEPNPFPDDLLLKLIEEFFEGTTGHIIVNRIEDVPQALMDANIADLDEEFGG